MMSDDLASFTTSIVKELTPELIRLLFKAIGVTSNIAKGTLKGTGKLLWGVTFKEKWAEFQVDRERLKKAGEQPLLKFLYKYPNLKSCDISQYEGNKKLFNDIMIKYRIPYTMQNDKNNMYIPKDFEYVWIEAEKELRQKMMIEEICKNKELVEKLEEKGIEAKNVDIIPRSEKGRIADTIEEDFLAKHIETVNFLKEKVKENRSGFLIQKPSVVVRDDFALMDIGNDQFKYIDKNREIVFNANVIRGVMESEGIKLDLTDKQINANMREYIRAADLGIRKMEHEVKNRSPLEKDFLIKTMIEKAQNPKMRIKAIMEECDLDKMIALREAERYGLNPTALVENDRSIEQIKALTCLKAIEQERGEKFDKQLKELFKEDGISKNEIDSMLNAVIENPNVSIGTLARMKADVKDQKEKYQELKTGKPSKQKIRQIEAEKSKRRNIDEAIREAHEEKMRKQMERIKPVPNKGKGMEK